VSHTSLVTRLAVAGETAICFCAVPFLLVWLVGWFRP